MQQSSIDLQDKLQQLRKDVKTLESGLGEGKTALVNGKDTTAHAVKDYNKAMVPQVSHAVQSACILHIFPDSDQGLLLSLVAPTPGAQTAWVPRVP